MTEQAHHVTTPFRSGEMYVNAVTATCLVLLDGEYEMAAQARMTPAALLRPLPHMTREDLLEFIAGATSQSENMLDDLGRDRVTTTD